MVPSRRPSIVLVKSVVFMSRNNAKAGVLCVYGTNGASCENSRVEDSSLVTIIKLLGKARKQVTTAARREAGAQAQSRP